MRFSTALESIDDPLHGHQEGRFFHGYYRCYCYLPLYIFCGEHLLCARLRAANQDGSAGSIEELERIVRQLRRRCPRTRIKFRGDSGFCRESIMRWCEEHDVGYVLGLARNARLVRALGAQMHEARSVHRRTGRPAGTAVPGLHLPHSKIVESQAPRGRQVGASIEGGEPALRGEQSLAAQGRCEAPV